MRQQIETIIFKTKHLIRIYNKIIMNEVKKLITLSGFTQKALAEKLGTKPERITEYKNGKHEITVNKLKKWCEILNIDIKYLF